MDVETSVYLARALAGQMDSWLSQPDANPTTFASSDLIEWCRAARDLLSQFGKVAVP